MGLRIEFEIHEKIQIEIIWRNFYISLFVCNIEVNIAVQQILRQILKKKPLNNEYHKFQKSDQNILKLFNFNKVAKI